MADRPDDTTTATPDPLLATTAAPRNDQERAVQELARLLDSRFRVPGTSLTFGVDAILGMIPGVGGYAGLVFGLLLIVRAIDAGAQPVTVVRMVGLAGLDALLSAVPVIGGVADFVLKANERNARTLRAHELDPAGTTESSRTVIRRTLIALVVAFGLFGLTVLLALFLLVRALFSST